MSQFSLDERHRGDIDLVPVNVVIDGGEDDHAAVQQAAPVHSGRVGGCDGREEGEDVDREQETERNDVDREAGASERESGRRQLLASDAFERDAADTDHVR